jgi:succinate dehydrogenase / fumarate reductase iron-sulfur subunit
MQCTFAVYRFDPAVDRKGRYQHYVVPAESSDKVLDCLNRIRWDQDPSLAFRASCAHGICGSDAMAINGRVALACQKLVRDYHTANHFVIEPLPGFGVIKDLVVDLRPFFEKHRAVRPHLVTNGEHPETERRQSVENQQFIEPALRCILCATCTASCPITRVNPDYLGPAALLRSFRYICDSRDAITLERLRKLDDENGIWGCETMGWCTEVCPKGIPVTKCLGQIKRFLRKEDPYT